MFLSRHELWKVLSLHPNWHWWKALQFVKKLFDILYIYSLRVGDWSIFPCSVPCRFILVDGQIYDVCGCVTITSWECDNTVSAFVVKTFWISLMRRYSACKIVLNCSWNHCAVHFRYHYCARNYPRTFPEEYRFFDIFLFLFIYLIIYLFSLVGWDGWGWEQVVAGREGYWANCVSHIFHVLFLFSVCIHSESIFLSYS